MMSVPTFESLDLLGVNFSGPRHGQEDSSNETTIQEASVSQKDFNKYEAVEDDNNNIGRISVPRERGSGSMQVAREIIGEILNLIDSTENSNATIEIGNDGIPTPVSCIGNEDIIDASKVPFACQDIRMKPGYVKPVPVKRPKVFKKMEVSIDTYNHHCLLALPGEAVTIPDIAEETWREASDEELGKELADKLQEQKSEMLVGLIKALGRNVILDYFWETQNTEERGGLLIMNKSRRRTSGGVFIQLLRISKDEKVRDKFETFIKETQATERRKYEEKVAEQKQKLGEQLKELVEEEEARKINEIQSDMSNTDSSDCKLSCNDHQLNRKGEVCPSQVEGAVDNQCQ